MGSRGGKLEHRNETSEAGRRRQAERVQAMRLARRASEASLRLTRPGISTPSPMRYASTGSPSDWVRADRGRGIIDGILDAIEDGADRVILAWSNRPGGGFAAAAVAMRE